MCVCMLCVCVHVVCVCECVYVCVYVCVGCGPDSKHSCCLGVDSRMHTHKHTHTHHMYSYNHAHYIPPQRTCTHSPETAVLRSAVHHPCHQELPSQLESADPPVDSTAACVCTSRQSGSESTCGELGGFHTNTLLPLLFH